MNIIFTEIEQWGPLFPIQAFFSSIPDRDFILVIRGLLHKEGRGYDAVDCTFPNDLDPCDEPFEGVEFTFLPNEVLVVDEATCYHFIKLACEEYVRQHPEDEAIIGRILEHSELTL